MNNIFMDFRYAARQFRKNLGFTTTALLTLALCIGANLTIFAVVDAILLRPLPFPDSDRLVTLYNTYPRAGLERSGASLTNYYERRGNIPAFLQIASLNATSSILGEAGSTERVDVGRVSSEFFSTLDTPMALGRAFHESEMTYQSDHEVVLTDSYWRQHYNADPNVVGKDMRTDGFLRKIVGVLPPDFRFLSSRAQIFLPLSSEEGERNIGARHNNNNLEIARLKPGATLGEAQAQIDAHNSAHAAEFPNAREIAGAGFRTIVAPLRADHVASIRPTLVLLQFGAFFLLLIGGVNLINLLLVRASNRTKELAVRQSMGASRTRVFGQVLTEITLLTAMGGACGVVVGAAGIRLLTALGADQLPLGATIRFDWKLAAVTLLGSAVMGALITVPIAWFNLRSHLANALQSESRSGTTNRSAQRLRYGFIVAQITLAFVLLAGAGLLGLSLKHVMAISPGFQTDHVLTGQISLPWYSYRTDASFLNFAEGIVQEIGRQPGVSAAGVISSIPMDNEPGMDAIVPVGLAPPSGASIHLHNIFGVFGNYFSAMGIPLRAGRFLENNDTLNTTQNCVVDEDFARRYWPQGDAVGHKISFIPTNPKKAFTIVGVVGTVKQTDLAQSENAGAVYLPYNSLFTRSYFVVARTSFAPDNLTNAMRKIVRQVDPDLPINDLRSMETRIDDTLVSRRSPALLTAVFACIALLLAAIGTYGVLNYAVTQRHREIGVRMALGALPQQVLSHFLGVGTRLLLVGLILGVVGAWAAGRAMESILFGVASFQAGIVAATGGVMMLVVLLACFIPARRAANVDPMVALRYE